MVLMRSRLAGSLFVCLALFLMYHMTPLSSSSPRLHYICASPSLQLAARSLHPSSSFFLPPSPSTSPAPPTVALCFFGTKRLLREDSYESIQEYLLNRLDEQGFRKDVFLHTYFDTEGDETDQGECKMLQAVVCKEEEVDKVDATIDIQGYLKYTNSSRRDVYELFRQLLSVHRCWDLIEKHINETGKAYRYVMLARSDAHYAAPGLPHLESLCLSEECRLEVGGWQRRLGVAYEDRFVMGVPAAVKAWATRDELALVYVDQYQRELQAETFSRWSLLWHDVEFVPFPFCFQRVSSSGREEPEDLARCRYGPIMDHQPPPVMRILPGTGDAFYAEDESSNVPPGVGQDLPIPNGAIKAAPKRRAERKGSPRRKTKGSSK